MLRFARLLRRTLRRRRAAAVRRRFAAALAARAAALFRGGRGGDAGDGVGVGDSAACVGPGRVQLVRAEIAGRAAGVQVWRLIRVGRLRQCGRLLR